MDVFLILFFAISAAVVIVGLFLKIKKIEKFGDIGLIKSDLLEINRSLESMKERISDRLDQNNYKMQESMQKQLAQSAKIISDVSHRFNLFKTLLSRFKSNRRCMESN